MDISDVIFGWINHWANLKPCMGEKTPQSNIHCCRLAEPPWRFPWIIQFWTHARKTAQLCFIASIDAGSCEILGPSPDPDPEECVWNWKGQGGRASAGGIKESQSHWATNRTEQRSDNCRLLKTCWWDWLSQATGSITEPWLFSAPSCLHVHNNQLMKGQHLPLARPNHGSLQPWLHFTSGQIHQRPSNWQWECFSCASVFFSCWRICKNCAISFEEEKSTQEEKMQLRIIWTCGF